MTGVAAILAGFALVAALLAWSRWLARRRLASLGHALLAVAAVWSALLLWSVHGSLESYETAVKGQPIAELYVEQTGSGRFRGMLTRLPAGRVQVFELRGDEWRLETRTLQWQGAAARLGLDPMYRLESLLTRAGPAGSAPDDGSSPGGPPVPSRFVLATDAGDDLWAKARTRPGWGRHLAGGHADTSWQPLGDKVLYAVRLEDGVLRVETSRAPAPAGTAPRG